MFSLEIDTDNAAFDCPEAELHRILQKIAKRVLSGELEDGEPIMDYNGNRVGKVHYDLDN